MDPVSPVISAEFVDKEVVYAKDQPQYRPLPVIRNADGVVMSRWSLTLEERKAIADGADLFLFGYTFNRPLQPVHMEVGGCGDTQVLMQDQLELDAELANRSEI